jgi:hypothetical protein
MSTKKPAAVIAADATTLEAIAYASVRDIPVVEPHDRDRLGYNVWRWLTSKKDPLEMCVRSAGARLLVREEQAVAAVRKHLHERGITE